MTDRARTENAGLQRNPALICAYHALEMSLFPMAVVTLFWKYQLGLDMTRIMLLQAIFGGTAALFEFPSGYVADRIGYRRTLLAASAVNAVGWTVYTAADGFWTIALAEVLLGLGLSLISGADSALLYESLVETGREEQFGRWFGRMRAFGQGAEGSTALLAGVLYALWPRLPFALQVAVWVANLFIAWQMVEPARHATTSRGHVERVRWIVSTALRDHPRLRALIFFSTALGLASFVPVWLIALYSEGAGLPVAWLGPLWAAANYVVALTALASDRLRRSVGLMPTLLLACALVTLGYAGLGLSHALFGFLFYYALTASRGLYGTVLHHEEQRLIPSGDRAGFVSLRSLLFRGSFCAIGPAVGAAVDRFGMHDVLLVTGAIASAAALAGWLWLLAARNGNAHARGS